MFCFTRFKKKRRQISNSKPGFSSPWDLIQSQNLLSPTGVYWTRSKVSLSLCDSTRLAKVRDARYIWFAATVQRMIHWWCSWSARAHRSTSHLLRLCPTASKPFFLSGMPPLWINLATREKQKDVSQLNSLKRRVKTRCHTGDGVKPCNKAEISLIVVYTELQRELGKFGE